MTDAAFQATYHDFKIIRTRKVVQVVLEAPLEHASLITDCLGFPDPAKEQWVAVAALNTVEKPELPKPTDNPEGHTAKKHFEASCNDPEFIGWMEQRSAISAYEGDSFRERLKGFMGIESANDFLKDPEVVKFWDQLFTSYKYRDEAGR